MVAEIRSGAVLGIEGFGVTVEIDLARGLPSFTIVGLPTAAVRESRERVTAAIKNNGFTFPQKRITVNLAPADVRKEGAAFDLPIALGILSASGQTSGAVPANALVLGELALDGRLKPVRGVLPIALLARSLGYRRMLVPEPNAPEGAAVREIEIVPCADLREAIRVVEGAPPRPAPLRADEDQTEKGTELDYAQVLGQHAAKRAMQIAAAGGHHVIMVGPPGSGKTMLAQRISSILPPLDDEEALEHALIMSVAGARSRARLRRERPFRAPHHSASDAGLIGGGRGASPGEITLAHTGVLFLDELTEFRRNVLECLRQPLEDGRVVISRANMSCSYPARFQLVAAMNPCPCGYAGSPRHACRCSPNAVKRYLGKISGPLVDRIGMYVPVQPVEPVDFDPAGAPGPMHSSEMREGVRRAFLAQRERFRGLRAVRRNADMPVADLAGLCGMGREAIELLSAAQRKLLLSARARRNVIQVARTIGDLEGSSAVEARHLAEAIQYRVPRLLECP